MTKRAKRTHYRCANCGAHTPREHDTYHSGPDGVHNPLAFCSLECVRAFIMRTALLAEGNRLTKVWYYRRRTGRRKETYAGPLRDIAENILKKLGKTLHD